MATERLRPWQQLLTDTAPIDPKVSSRYVVYTGSTFTEIITDAAGNEYTPAAGGGGGVAWGSITGTLTDQTDLVTALGLKADKSITVSAGTGLTGGGDLSTNRTLAANFGSSSGTICQGNDARLSDARTPTSHSHATSDITGLVNGLAIQSAQTASFTAAVGNLYPVNLSGASGHFEVTFPGSPAAGNRFALFVSVAHSTWTYSVKPVVSGAPSIAGVTGHDNKWSLWEVGERLDFVYDGSTWQVEHDGRIAHACALNRNTAQSSVGPSATKLLLNNVLTNTAGMADTATNNRIDIKRDGKYDIMCSGAISPLSDGERGDFLVYINGTGGTLALFARGYSSRASATIGVGQGKQRTLAAGDYLELYQGTNAAGSTSSSAANEAGMPTLCAQEVL